MIRTMVMFQRLVRLIPLTCLLVVGFAHSGFAGEPLQPRAEIGLKGGSDRSLMTTEFWAPLAQKRNQVLYADIRLMGDNDENREGNLGFGYREINSYTNTVTGGHLWIDRRRTQNNSNFHQLTFGAESLGHHIDLRANGYIPLNGPRNLGSSSVTAPYLAGSGIFYDINGFLVETPQYGMDGEIGYRLPILQKQIDTLRIYGGGYHFFRTDTQNVTGIRIRTEAQINSAFSVGARFQHDAARGSQGFLEATLKFPFSAKKLYQDDGLHSRLDESPERDVDIVTSAQKTPQQTMVPVINTTTGQQQRVLYVDNTNTASGDGSKNNPFNTLIAAQVALQANDVLYINHGDGTTTGMDQGITIDKANVTLIGSGSNFVYDAGKFTTQAGDNFSGTLLAAATAAPVITNTQTSIDVYTGNGIYITEDNVYLSGITINGATRNGIFVNAAGGNTPWNNVTISNLETSNNINHGIYILADNNTLDTVSIQHITSKYNSRGIQIQAANGTARINTLNIENNVMSENNSSGMYIIASVQGAIETINLSHNTSTGNLGTNGHGIWIHALGANSVINNVNITDNTANTNAQNGIYVFAQSFGKIGTAKINNNTSNGNSNIGIRIYSNANALIDNLTINNNIAKNNPGSGVYVSTLTNSRIIDTSITNNILENNNTAGIYFLASTTGQMDQVVINNNTLSENGYGMYIYANSATGIIGDISITNNTAERSTLSGIYFFANSGQINAATVQNNVTNNNTQHGLYFYAAGTGIINNSSVFSNTMTGNTLNGLYLHKNNAAGVLNVDLGGGAYGSIGQNNISGNTGNDIRLNYTGGGSAIAKNNYWGGGALTRVQLTAATTIDSSAFLTTAP